MGDAGEMLVAAELTLHGIPAFTVPNNRPGYDVIAECPERGTQRISVKTRTFAKSGSFVPYNNDDVFDWFAIVILPAEGCPRRRIFIIPRKAAEARSYEAKSRDGRGFFVHKLVEWPTEPITSPPPAGGAWPRGLRRQLLSQPSTSIR